MGVTVDALLGEHVWRRGCHSLSLSEFGLSKPRNTPASRKHEEASSARGQNGHRSAQGQRAASVPDRDSLGAGVGSSRAGYFKQRRLCRPGLSVRGRVCCREARRGARRPASPSAGRGRQLQASRPAQASGQRWGCRELLRGGGVSCCCFSGIGNCALVN